MRRLRFPALIFLATMLTGLAAGAVEPPMPSGSPDATVDLGTAEGVALVNGQWRYSDTRIVEVAFRNVGAEGQPTGSPNRTYDFTPHAGAADFDDSEWQSIDAATLEQRRGN